MEKMSFGEILRTTRERKGLELNATARRLRIRPDILQAIEDSNFAAMPPRGYARNMVNGYARYLGLNPTEITGMYLDELYAYQVDYETSHKRPTGIDMPVSQGDARALERNAARNSNRRTYYEREERDSTLAQVEARGSSRSRRRSSRGEERLYPESRTHQARGSALPTTSYTNYYASSGPVGFLQANWRYIVAALVGLIVLGLVISQVMSCSRRTDTEVETVPVSGMDSSDVPVVEAPKAPTNFTMEYSVDNGEVSWIEVYVDGEIQVGEAVEGPQTQTFTSADTIQFITANPYPVTVRIDGEKVDLETDDTGVVNMTWNFSDILAQWLADHPGVSAASTTTTTTSTSSGSSTTSSSSTGTTMTVEDGGTANTDGSGVASGAADATVGIDSGAVLDANGSVDATDGSGYVDTTATTDYTDTTGSDYASDTTGTAYTDSGYTQDANAAA